MRRILIPFLLFGLMPQVVCAQIFDDLIGKKRVRVQQTLRAYRILDYQRDRVEYVLEKGIRQTVIYSNDTCTRFYWAVNADKIPGFISSLKEAGYGSSGDSLFSKPEVTVMALPLASGKATLFTAKENLTKAEDADPPEDPAAANGKHVYAKSRIPQAGKRGQPIVLALPLMQQEALRAAADTTPPKKDPKRNWIGDEDAETQFLGW